jgi:PAS domain S-box-containing protein
LLTLFKSIRLNQLYWKERAVSTMILATYIIGNLIEYFSGKLTNDSPFFWIIAIAISTTVLVLSYTSQHRLTTIFFKISLIYVNFQVAYVYGNSTSGSKDIESFYLMSAYIVFVVLSQVADSKREIILYTVLEVLFLVFFAYIFIENSPIILQTIQLLMLGVVLVGNLIIVFQRLKLTQVEGATNIQFKALTENARDVQSIINEDLNYVYVNPTILDVTGYHPNELIKDNFLKYIVAEDRPLVTTSLLGLREELENKQSIEYRTITKSGRTIWLESILSSFKNNQNEDSKMIFVETRNIEDRKQQELAIKQQLKIEELLIRHSNNFINTDRKSIPNTINSSIAEAGKILDTKSILIYRLIGKLSDDFRCTNQWYASILDQAETTCNLVVKINHDLLIFLNSLKGEQAAKGSIVDQIILKNLGILVETKNSNNQYYILPLQNGNSVNGLVLFVFGGNTSSAQSNFFALIGNMMANAFTRLRTETRLQEEQLTNESILRALPDWLYTINKDGIFTGSNNYSTLDTYLPDFGLEGRPLFDVLPNHLAVKFNNALDEVVNSGFTASFEYDDNSIQSGKSFKAIIAPFKTNEYLIIIRDITELKTAQHELESKAIKLKQSNKELEEFAYVVSHDMKQPIRTIVSYLSLLKRRHTKELSAEALEFIQYSIEGANKMSDLIRDILQYSKLEQQISNVKEVDLNRVVGKVINGLKDFITTGNATVHIDQLPTVNGNETMLNELFQNLIENGIKYNKSEKKYVSLTVADKGQYWAFEVKDNGIGFDEQYAQQIFKIFKRLHGDEEFQGTGIGLSICHKVVENHGGKIWAHSKIGEGSTFHFTLPKN